MGNTCLTISVFVCDGDTCVAVCVCVFALCEYSMYVRIERNPLRR